MMKIAGCCLVIGATTLLGIEKAGGIKRQLHQMKYLQQLIYLLQSEIRYARSFLGEIFEKIGQDAIEPYKTWLLELGKNTINHEGMRFELIWSESIEKYLKKIRLPQSEWEALKALGKQMGFADIKVQNRMFEIYLEQLEHAIREVQEDIKVKVRLCHCLGVMSGILISVLLL